MSVTTAVTSKCCDVTVSCVRRHCRDLIMPYHDDVTFKALRVSDIFSWIRYATSNPWVSTDSISYFWHHGMKIKLCCYVIQSTRLHSGSQRPAADCPRGVWWTVSDNNTVLSLYAPLNWWSLAQAVAWRLLYAKIVLEWVNYPLLL